MGSRENLWEGGIGIIGGREGGCGLPSKSKNL